MPIGEGKTACPTLALGAEPVRLLRRVSTHDDNAKMLGQLGIVSVTPRATRSTTAVILSEVAQTSAGGPVLEPACAAFWVCL